MPGVADLEGRGHSDRRETASSETNEMRFPVSLLGWRQRVCALAPAAEATTDNPRRLLSAVFEANSLMQRRLRHRQEKLGPSQLTRSVG